MTTSPDYTVRQACGKVWAWTNYAPVVVRANHCTTSTRTRVHQMVQRVPAKSASLRSGQRKLQAAHQSKLFPTVQHDGNTASSGEPQTKAKFGHKSMQRQTHHTRKTRRGAMHGRRLPEQYAGVFNYQLYVRVARR
jgi:hypothetical protein